MLQRKWQNSRLKNRRDNRKNHFMSLNIKSTIEGYIMVLPALLFLSVFMIIPIILGFYYSLQSWDGFNTPTFVGLKNYINIIFNDSVFRVAFKNTFIFAISVVIGKNVLGLFLAVLVNQKLYGTRFFRTSIFLPVSISFVAVGLLWSWIYNPNFGLLAEGLKLLGLDHWVSPWLGDKDTVLWSIILVDIWKWVGFHMVLYLAGLQTISSELYEAAKIDGAIAWQRFFYITIPML